MTDADRAKLREMQAKIRAIGREVASAETDAARAEADARLMAAQRAQIDFLRGLGFNVA